MFHVKHVIFSLGLGGGTPIIPNIPGREEFQGQVLHSTQHKSAKDHIGKKVFIIGACTSGRVPHCQPTGWNVIADANH